MSQLHGILTAYEMRKGGPSDRREATFKASRKGDSYDSGHMSEEEEESNFVKNRQQGAGTFLLHQSRLLQSILLQSPWRTHQSRLPWRTHQSRPHKRTYQSRYNRHGEHINPSLTGELIILLHRRVNHLIPQESESSCSSTHHQRRVSHPVVICCSSRNRKPSELPELNVCNMQDPCTRVSC